MIIVSGFFITTTYSIGIIIARDTNYMKWSFDSIIVVTFTVSQLAVFSNLYFFGCAVSICKENKSAGNLTSRERDAHDFIEFLKIESKVFLEMKESMSTPLFIIFTCITVVDIFFIFTTIRNFSIVLPNVEESVTHHLVDVFWCIQLSLILVYVGVVADEFNELRIVFIDYIW